MTSEMFPTVQGHLTKVAKEPSLPLDERLLEEFQAQLTENTDRASVTVLLDQLSAVLPTLQQDPTPVINLVRAAIRPASFRFNDVLSIQPPVDFIAGFNSLSTPLNLATLELLEKATYTASDAAIVAGQRGVVMSLTRLWLSTSETAVAQKALEVIWGLLEIDHQSQSPEDHAPLQGNQNGNTTRGEGQGLVWRRLFNDRDIYEQILSICSLKTVGQPNQPSKRDKTVAQARLMDLVPRVAKLDWGTVSVTRFPDIESNYGIKDGGLVEFTALHMVDFADDLLMHVTLIDFFTELLGMYSSGVFPLSTFTGHLRSMPGPSPSLAFLIRHGLHQRTASFYLEPSKHESIEVTYVYSKAAKYLAIYAACYPDHLLESAPPMVDPLLSRVSQALSVSPNQWLRDTELQHDLHVLASLPRVTLIPSSNNTASALLKVPVKPANGAALRTIATIFHGPEQLQHSNGLPLDALADPNDPTSISSEAAAARLLYFYYLQHHPEFWSQVINTAEIIALKDNALAAISLLSAVITAHWMPLPNESSSNTTAETPATQARRRFLLPTEQQARNLPGFPPGQLAPSGVLAILSSPAVDVVLPYLLRPAQTFSNLVGGRGDVESAAYRVATAKFDLLTLFHRQLSQMVSDGVEGLQDVLTAVRRRLAEGPLAGSSEVGGRVGTLEL